MRRLQRQDEAAQAVRRESLQHSWYQTASVVFAVASSVGSEISFSEIVDDLVPESLRIEPPEPGLDPEQSARWLGL